MENTKNGKKKTTLIITTLTITSTGNLNRINDNTKNKQVDWIKTITQETATGTKTTQNELQYQHPGHVVTNRCSH